MSKLINETTINEVVRNTRNENMTTHKSTMVKQCQQCQKFVYRDRRITFESWTRNYHCDSCLQVRVMDRDIDNQKLWNQLK